MEKDKPLKGKGTYSLDGRYLYYIVENEGEKAMLETRFPGVILCCDKQKSVRHSGERSCCKDNKAT